MLFACCANCRWWVVNKSYRDPRDGRPVSGSCQQGPAPVVVGRLHRCEKIKLKA